MWKIIDRTLVELIKRFVKTELPGQILHQDGRGHPAGGPSDPHSSHIYLNRLISSWRKEATGSSVTRITIFVQISGATGRVIESNIRFLEEK